MKTSKADQTIELVQKAIENSPTGVSFFHLKGYTATKSGEVADHLVNVGFSYENAKNTDIEMLKNLDVKTLKSNFGIQLLEEARTALLGSLISPSKARSQGQTNAYTQISKSLKVNNENGNLYVYALAVKKTIITEGEYKPVKSKDLTLAKKEIKKLMKTNKFRQFKITSEQVKTLSGRNTPHLVL